jgi:uncharacterized protein YbjT (DUF2867 family)
LSRALLRRGHAVSAFARAGGAGRAEPGCDIRELDVFDEAALTHALRGHHTLVHLVGTPHPNPRKSAEFRRVDLASVWCAAQAARQAGIENFVYVSVAQPAPVMRAYVQARREAEDAIRASGLAATFLRPWYVLGPGHRWPYLLAPLYAIAKYVPGARDTARRLDLVTLDQMTRALTAAVETPPPDGAVRVVAVPQIRATARSFKIS